MLAPPWLLALGLVIGLLVLIPARRLRAADLSANTIGLYALVLWLFAMVIAIRPGATRLLVPILLVAYLAPFIASPEVIGRVLGRVRPAKPPIKNVTPPDPPGLPRGDRDDGYGDLDDRGDRDET